MFISRVQLNPRRRGAVALLSNPQALHAGVESAFPDPQHGRVLWRLDTKEHSTHLIVVSQQRPDLTHLVEQGGWPDTAPYEVKDYDAHLARLANGQRVSIQLKANTTKRDTKSGKVIGVGSAPAQLDWFAERAAGCGLELTPSALGIASRGRQQFAHRHGTISHDYADFTGVAKVTDVEALREKMTTGVGRARAYGFGLLTAIPV